jgi:hypothetical protein
LTALIQFNPYTTTSPSNPFLLQTQGYVEGMPYDDTVSRLWLMSGTLASTETLPMWGGVAIAEYINVAGSGADALGPSIVRATSSITPTGFSTFLSQMHMVITPGTTAPVAGSLNSVGFFRFGSNQRLAVKIDPSLVSTITGTPTLINNGGTTLYWDTTNYRITTTSTSNAQLPSTVKILSINTNSKITSYSGGVLSWTTGTAALILI